MHLLEGKQVFYPQNTNKPFKALIGKKIEFIEGQPDYRGFYISDWGIIEKVEGKNIYLDNGKILWIPKLYEVAEKP